MDAVLERGGYFMYVFDEQKQAGFITAYPHPKRLLILAAPLLGPPNMLT